MFRSLSLLFGIGIAAAATAAPPAFDARPWLDDYASIKRGMAQYYANLDGRLASLRVDPVRLDRQVTARLAAARSDLEAYDTLRSFVELFDDSHLQFRFDAPSAMDSGNVAAAAKATVDCASAGYKDGRKDLAARMAALPGWRPIGGGAFPHGAAGPIGVLRIASFSESTYVEQCRRALRPGMSERELQLATRAVLQAELTSTVAALKAAGATRLLIDVTGNGGGSEWDREAAALFTATVMRRARPRIADAPCERSAVWTGKRPCEVFRRGGEIDTIAGTAEWTGPVAILADRRTASAAEEFIGWLVDNRVATLVGEQTMGAGCGYVDGGRPVTLKAAPITLLMPNCARFTAAGDNEIEGWKPATPLAFPRDGAEAAWGKALREALGG